MNRRDFVKTCGIASTALLAPQISLARAAGESDAAFNARMAWWRESRFGMFIHWGIYSVPAGVWKGKRVTRFPGEWIRFAKNIPKSQYEPLAAQFNPVKFNAREWAKLAKDAGMKYMVPTSKHHDGFCMFDSQLTKFDIMDATPFKRDVIGELSRACVEEGVRFGFYHSELDWHWAISAFSGIIPHFSAYLKYMKGQLKELFTNYGPIGSVFFDGQWMLQWNNKVGRDMLDYCRSLSPATVFNDRLGKKAFTTLPGLDTSAALRDRIGDYSTPEQYIPKKNLNDDWETCMTFNDSWGYRSWDNNWKSANDLIRDLVDIVSKGGNFLLNVGPTAEGLIPEPCIERLRAMGDWLKPNAEAIYGTTAGPLQNLKWGRTTQKPGKIFLSIFDWPTAELKVSGLPSKPGKAYLLADAAKTPLPFKYSDNNLIISLPEKPLHPAATVIVLE